MRHYCASETVCKLLATSLIVSLGGCANFYSGMSDSLPIATPKSACRPFGSSSVSTYLIERENINAAQIRARLTAVPPQPNTTLFGVQREVRNLPEIQPNSPVWLATEVLGSETHRKIHGFLLSSTTEGLIFGAPKDSETTRKIDLKLSAAEFVTYAKNLEKVTLIDGWRELEIAADKQAKTLMGASPAARDEIVNAIRSEAAFLSTYMSAYFRKGHFYSVSLKREKLEAQLRERLRSESLNLVGLQLPDCQDDPEFVNTPERKKTPEQLVNHYSCEIDNKIGDLTKRLCKAGSTAGVCTMVSRISESGFVTRGGASFAFPIVDVSVDPLSDKKVSATRIDTGQVAQDIVRVAVEATGDALADVPAVIGSTACDNALLTCFDPAETGVTEDRFARVNDYGDRAEALSASVVGKMVRGVSWVSLNNEAIAKALETFISVGVRKVTEAATWTYVASPSCAPASVSVLGAGNSIGNGTSIRTLAITIDR